MHTFSSGGPNSFSRFDCSVAEKATKMFEGVQDKLHISNLPDSFQVQPPQMWTKLRPGVHDFLAAAAKLFELHICTMGDRQYAEQMAQILDPDRSLFAERIISNVRNSLSHPDSP